MLNLYQIVDIALVSFQHCTLSWTFICSETHSLQNEPLNHLKKEK